VSRSRRPAGDRPRRRPPKAPPTDSADRALSPVVGKTLELGVGVLFVALLTATFFGAVAPDYRAAVGSEVGDRTLAAAADRIESAVPGTDYPRVDRGVAVRLPETIRGDPYRIVADGGTPSIALVHPERTVGGRLRLDLSAPVTVRGSWRSTSPSRVVVDGAGGNLSVRLVDVPSERGTDGSSTATDREGSA
jgi:hypothetical protein